MCKESKRDWKTQTINLESIDFSRHPKNLGEILSVDASITSFFNFHGALNVDGSNKETKRFGQESTFVLEIPVIDEKVNEMMKSLSFSS
jgi:hypothetical protein